MTGKNGGNTTGEVQCAGLCDCCTEQAVPVRVGLEKKKLKVKQLWQQ